MNRDTKTASALIALARTRRIQRALAHAYLHRNAPLPTLGSSLGYLTATTRVTEPAATLGHPTGMPSGQGGAGPLPHARSIALGHPTGIPSGQGGAGPLPHARSIALGHPTGIPSGQGGAGPLPHARSIALGHRMALLGIARHAGVAYIVEELGDDRAPIVYRLHLRGLRQGHLVPLHAWYEHSDDVGALRARIAQLVPTLEPALPTAPEAFMLSTRIVQRRALRIAGPGACCELPIRKFALQLVVEPVCAVGPSGRSTVTAYLQPHAQLTEVWSLASRSGASAAGDAAIARVTFTGIPSGTGLSKDTVVLLTSGLYGSDDPDSHA